MSFDKNKFIGIKFKINKRDFNYCDCRGIVWLYYKHVKGIDLPFSDGQSVVFRDKNKDFSRISSVLNSCCAPVTYKELKEGDIVVLKAEKTSGALGVCIDKYKVLHMDKIIGSCLTKKELLESVFLIGYRPIC